MSSLRENLGTRAYSALMFCIVSILAGVLLSLLVVPGAAVAGEAARMGAKAIESLPKEFAEPPVSEGSKVLLNDGSELAVLYAEDRQVVKKEQIAPIMMKAQIAIEDKRFYDHKALDFRGFLRAAVKSGGSQGGSTISQQYIKQMQIEAAVARADKAGIARAQERTIARKVQELKYAIALEKNYNKDEILVKYLNIAYYGSQYGIESAAKHYFNISAKDLNIPQAAMLAGLVQNPAATDPGQHPIAALERRNQVLVAMHDQKIITDKEFEESLKVPFDPKLIQPNRNNCVGSKFPHVCQYAVDELVQMGIFGKPKDALESLKRQGFQIKLTIDPELEDFAIKRLTQAVAPSDPAIATFNAVQPGTGKILVMAQSRPVIGDDGEKGESWFNYSVIGSQWHGAEGYQAGSTFKPLTIATAIDKGVPPTKRYSSPSKLKLAGTTYSCDGVNMVIDPSYQPQNEEGKDYGVIDMYKAAQDSVNTYFLQLARDVGNCDVARMAENLGVKSPRDLYAEAKQTITLTLGAPEVAPLSMASAYSVFAGRGKQCTPTMIESITTRDGKPVALPDNRCKQVIKPEVADGVNAVLRTVSEKGSAQYGRAPGNYDQAGKTGTTDYNATVWLDTYSPDVAVSGMITPDKLNPYWKDPSHTVPGENGQRHQTLKGQRMPVSGTRLTGTGAGDVSPFHKDIITRILKKTPGTKFTPPGSEILSGKMVPVPVVSNRDPKQDEQTLKEKGFSVVREDVNSPADPGTYLGASQSGGMLPVGSTISLRFSKGPVGFEPSPAPTTNR